MVAARSTVLTAVSSGALRPRPPAGGGITFGTLSGACISSSVMRVICTCWHALAAAVIPWFSSSIIQGLA